MINNQICKALLKAVVGVLVLIVATLIVIQFPNWLSALIELIKGIILIIIIVAGLFLIVIGFTDLKK